MVAFEARRLGFRTAILDPDPRGPAGQVADEAIAGSLSDASAILELARRCDVLTVETEHVSAAGLEAAAELVPVRPGAGVLRAVQDRLEQKRFLQRHGFPQPAFAPVEDEAGLRAAVAQVGAPSVLKARRGGYDGKGQARLAAPGDALGAWESIGRAPAILEAFVPFELEVSAVLARGADGEVRAYPVAENEHRRGILRTTCAPARVPEPVAAAAVQLASGIAQALGHVGVIAVEMFLLPDGSLQVNEIAPRVHNSGHFTLGACVTSQFEQHLRAVLGLPLGETRQHTPAAMLNLLGDLWQGGAPDWQPVLAEPGAHLHLYGKARASPGRKMGHVTLLGPSTDAALAAAERLDAALAAPPAAGTPIRTGRPV
jgi:5-(carboxyamino)imidazole ribonucleotide synthase